jgi:hypothetical protein
MHKMLAATKHVYILIQPSNAAVQNGHLVCSRLRLTVRVLLPTDVPARAAARQSTQLFGPFGDRTCQAAASTAHCLQRGQHTSFVRGRRCGLQLTKSIGHIVGPYTIGVQPGDDAMNHLQDAQQREQQAAEQAYQG